MAATTFHLFPHLPWELRAQIWELTITPRTVEVKFLDNKPQDNLQLPRRYVYVNFDFDALLLRNGTSLHHFVLSPFVQQQNYKTRIKRLVIERNMDMAY
ncbi:hypothetical protein N0V85_002816 [Neurospora sp. IMI 360204]|nr:hypothetical protein N0V85_002816 [Neurospora sp. IMI 360204]